MITQKTESFKNKIASLKQSMDFTYLKCQELIKDIENAENISISIDKKIALDVSITFLEQQINEYKKLSLFSIG